MRDLVVMMNDEPVEGWTLPPKLLGEALARAGVRPLHRQRTPLSRTLARAFVRTPLFRPNLFRPSLFRPFGTPKGSGGVIAPMCWGFDSFAFPDAMWRTLIPWGFDCWGPEFPRWEATLRKHKVPLAFFSARDAANHFARAISGLETIWLPEACDARLFSPQKPLAERSIKVLELGRKLERVHEKIREPLRERGHTHVYSLDGANTVLFAGVEALYKGLGDTALALCFPKSVTHPDKAGGVETMTQRYLEFIGSGTLPIGSSPREIVDLFGFDPVIALDERDPAAQILAILDDLPKWQAHADRARARFLEVGTFDTRAKAMLEHLAQRGYVVPTMTTP